MSASLNLAGASIAPAVVGLATVESWRLGGENGSSSTTGGADDAGGGVLDVVGGGEDGFGAAVALGAGGVATAASGLNNIRFIIFNFCVVLRLDLGFYLMTNLFLI